MVQVIKDFGMTPLKLTEEDFLKPCYITQIGQLPLRLDILNNIDGLEFEDAKKNMQKIAVDGLEISYIGLHDFIRNKQVSGRIQDLADIKEIKLLNEIDTTVKIFLNDKIRTSSVYEYIHAHYDQHADVNEMASRVRLGIAAFCRYFKKQTKMTFTDFVNQYRISQVKTLLLQDKSISETCFAVGYESASHFNKLFLKLTGENPSQFKKRHLCRG